MTELLIILILNKNVKQKEKKNLTDRLTITHYIIELLLNMNYL